MDHTYAMGENIAERYFLGELTKEDAEAYEAHYFECAICAEYVREELTMLESGRAVALEEKRSSAPLEAAPAVAPVVDIASRRKGRAWFTHAAAAAVAAIAVGTPFLMRSPVPLAAAVERGQLLPVDASVSRAAVSDPKVFRAGKPIVVLVTIDASEHPNYDLSIRNASGERVGERVRVSGEEASEPIPLQSRPLPAGRYEVVIEGVREDGNRTEIAMRSFQVQ